MSGTAYAYILGLCLVSSFQLIVELIQLFLEAFLERRLVCFRLNDSQLSILLGFDQLLIATMYYLNLHSTQKRLLTCCR